jgi:DNA-binding response OmpR family regulator
MTARADRSSSILVVEDDEEIAEPLIFGLSGEGFRVLHAADGLQALELARLERPDLILLDIMLPGLDGFGLCRTLRAESAVPIIMMTARGQELERVMGLELGADDYVVKPFSFRELVARVRAVLRRQALERGQADQAAERLEVGAIQLDRAARLAWLGGQPLVLTQREFNLLALLMERAGQAVPRQVLLDRAWGEGWIGDARTLDVHIRWLREKLEADPSNPRYIQTVRGFGYRLVDPDAPPVAD